MKLLIILMQIELLTIRTDGAAKDTAVGGFAQHENRWNHAALILAELLSIVIGGVPKH